VQRREARSGCGSLAAAPPVRAVNGAPPDAQGCPKVSGAQVVRSICRSRVPGWSSLAPGEILIDQLPVGLSNRNFRVCVAPTAAAIPCVLFRAYGEDASKFYDTELEFRIFNMLSGYQIAPRMYAFGDGWRIEEWHFAVPLPNRSMRNPAIFAQVAAQFGRLHKLSARGDFPRELLAMPPLSQQRLASWGEACRRAAGATVGAAGAELPARPCVEEMLSERLWLAAFLLEGDPQVRGSGLDRVFCHWDCQENNILQTQYGLRFIDFEYSGMEHQAFDIATYFAECMIDYIHDKHPFFKVGLSSLPAEWEQRLFGSIYLSEYLESTVRAEDTAVSLLLERVRRFMLASHLLWAFWSVIRAQQAPAPGGFDYLRYARLRWRLYRRAKRSLLQGAVGPA